MNTLGFLTCVPPNGLCVPLMMLLIVLGAVSVALVGLPPMKFALSSHEAQSDVSSTVWIRVHLL